ncbi:MAG: hypothetical protein ACK5WZ_10940 [Pseudobdellovibrionaceae bacterium]|jgi:predicted nucleic acid-binding protein
MKVFRGVAALEKYLTTNRISFGCLADTGFLYALAYKDDRLFDTANDVHDLLVEHKAPIYSNVISRVELIDLIFRKQVTLGCVKLFESATSHSFHKPIYNTLKDIRDKNTASTRNHESYKVDEGRLKKVRKQLVDEYGMTDWSDFCSEFVDEKLLNEWTAVEQELGLNFIEVMEGEKSDLFNHPVRWNDMVELMGKKGLRGPDAMIANLFDKSKFELLITSDSDFKNCFADQLEIPMDKAILVL